jgi:YidC/Oxa1 family membrane protein insertase
MTNFRALWWIALTFTLFMLYMEWTQFVAQKEQPAQVAVSQSPVTPVVAGDVPQAPVALKASVGDVPAGVSSQPSAQRISVTTDVLNIQLDSKGGDLRFASLTDYFVSRHDDAPFTLMSDKSPYLFLAQTGFSAQGVAPAPNHHEVFSVEKTEFVLAANADELRVPLKWEKDGIKVEKTYVFKRGSYTVRVDYAVTNGTDQTWQAAPYYQLVRNTYDPTSSFWLPTYTGGAVYDPVNKFDKIDFDDMKTQALSREATGGWLTMMQHYFLAAFVPNAQDSMHYYTKVLESERYALGMIAPAMTVSAGASASTSVQLYAGPKLQGDLEALAAGLELTVDYGVLSFMAQPMFWLLEHLSSWVEPFSGLWSWGWAIILVTIILKALFYKLSEAGYKSMANLRKLAPRLQHLKDNYGHDKMMFQQKMMELYKTEKINPLGGCLPILIQIPVFLALYWVLLEAVELRMTPFLWLDDLSQYDPFFILPILMGLTMIVQQKLNPPPTDPMQEKIMKFLPYIFTVTFLFMPSGLVLYWVVNNGLSILQQWHITRKIEAMDKPPAHHHS